jgi:hypothetical protein
MPFLHSHDPTEATAAMKATGPTEAAAVAASQLSSHFGAKATVKATGSTVTISSPHGIKEDDWPATLTLPTTTAVPQIARMGISMKNTDGEWEALDDSAPAATSVINKDFRKRGEKAQALAVTTGASAYSITLSPIQLADGVTSAFGDEEATAGKPKKVNAATIFFGPPEILQRL